jgi:hypothetical protein
MSISSTASFEQIEYFDDEEFYFSSPSNDENELFLFFENVQKSNSFSKQDIFEITENCHAVARMINCWKLKTKMFMVLFQLHTMNYKVHCNIEGILFDMLQIDLDKNRYLAIYAADMIIKDLKYFTLDKSQMFNLAESIAYSFSLSNTDFIDDDTFYYLMNILKYAYSNEKSLFKKIVKEINNYYIEELIDIVLASDQNDKNTLTKIFSKCFYNEAFCVENADTLHITMQCCRFYQNSQNGLSIDECDYLCMLLSPILMTSDDTLLECALTFILYLCATNMRAKEYFSMFDWNIDVSFKSLSFQDIFKKCVYHIYE